MGKHNKYALLGLRALKRAKKKVIENSRKNNLKMPVWKDGRIEYEIPGTINEQGVSEIRNTN